MKTGFILKILQIDFYPLQGTPHFYLYAGAYEFSVVQSSAAGHHLTPCSTGLPFPISPHMQTEIEFLSKHFSLWGTSKSHGAKTGELRGLH
jgi:hypothetical protein